MGMKPELLFEFKWSCKVLEETQLQSPFGQTALWVFKLALSSLPLNTTDVSLSSLLILNILLIYNIYLVM